MHLLWFKGKAGFDNKFGKTEFFIKYFTSGDFDVFSVNGMDKGNANGLRKTLFGVVMPLKVATDRW